MVYAKSRRTIEKLTFFGEGIAEVKNEFFETKCRKIDLLLNNYYHCIFTFIKYSFPLFSYDLFPKDLLICIRFLFSEFFFKIMLNITFNSTIFIQFILKNSYLVLPVEPINNTSEIFTTLTKNNSIGCQQQLFLNNKITTCRRTDYCCHINIYMKQFIAEKNSCVSMSSNLPSQTTANLSSPSQSTEKVLKNESNINLRKEYTSDTCDRLTNCYKSCNSIVPTSYVCYDTGNFAKYNNGLDSCYSKCFTDKYKCPLKNIANKEDFATFIFVIVVVCIFVVALFVTTLCGCNYICSGSSSQISPQQSFNSV